MAYCSRCGNPLKKEANYCHKCGHPVSRKVVKKYTNSRVKVIVAVAIGLIANVGLCFFLFNGHTSKKQSTHYRGYSSYNTTTDNGNSYSNEVDSVVDELAWDSVDTVSTEQDDNKVYSNYDDEEVEPISNSTYKSSSTSVSLINFRSVDDVYIWLRNRKFVHSSGVTLSYDDTCQLYINGEWNAPIFSVLKFTIDAAHIKCHSPIDGPRLLFVYVVDNKLRLVDPIDGSVFYQK